jgi:CHAD domain-containing protein
MRQRLSALMRVLPAARNGDVDAIHRARVATRRLREALPLTARGAAGRKLQKLVRRLTRALGPVRELDVALLTLDELGRDADAPGAAIACLRQTIEEERRRLWIGVARDLERPEIQKRARKAITASRGRTRGRAADASRLQAARKRAVRRAASLQSAIESAGAIYLPDRLHQVRIAVKKLRYALEIARELRGLHAATHLRALKGAQDLLGRMHDLEVLIMRVRALQGSGQAPDLKLSAELDRLVRRLEMECRQLHVRYMAFKKKLRVVCDDVTSADARAA